MKKQDMKWILVTGGSRGIGAGLVKHLAISGYFVVFTYYSSSKEAKILEKKLNTETICCSAHQCDGRSPLEIEELVTKLVECYGTPIGLINNAGMTCDQSIFNLDSESLNNVLRTNLQASINFCKWIAKAMVNGNGGVILNMSSVTAFKGNPGQVSYAATKAGLIGLSKTMALELARFNIRVNTIAPGFIETEMIQTMEDRKRGQIVKTIPLRRMGQVDDVAHLVIYLVSDQAAYITGQTFTIDGGLTA